jgi:serine/threonine protein phosphatase PrpC
VAISDGHGSSAHPHSEHGSKFAVAISLEAYKEILVHDPSSLDPIDLFQKIITKWSAQCISHYSQYISGDDTTDESVLKLYGATLCIAYVAGDSITVGSLGDSTVFFRNHSGHFSKFLIHDNSPGESTFSLCQSNPLSRVEVVHIPYSSGIIVLSTDGIIKSLKSSADYELIADYYLGLLNSDCPSAKFSADLTSQLESFSRDGSGDDCTLAMVYIPQDPKLDANTKVLNGPPHAHVDNSPSKTLPALKKKVSASVVTRVTLTFLLLITILLAAVVLYNPIKNQLMLLIRSTLCSKDLDRGQPPNLLIQVQGQ